MDDVAGGVFHQDFARLQAVALQTFGGGSVVVFNSLIDELKFFNGCGGGVVVYQTCRQGELVGTIFAFVHRSFVQRRGIPPVENNLVIQGNVNEMSVALAYDGDRGVVAGRADALDVELVARVFHTDGNTRGIVGKPCLAFLHFIGGECQHLKPPPRIARDHSQCHRYGEAYHARAGNTDTHGILEHILAEQDFYLFRLFA